MTRGEALCRGQAQLQGYLQSPRLEAEILLTSLLDCSGADLLAHPEQELSSEQEARLENWLHLRRLDYPLQYLRAYQEFYGRRFRVSPEVLIPRPETETLVEMALQRLAKHSGQVEIADIATGSGCIAVTLCSEILELRCLATDIHFPALRIARENARICNCEDRIGWVCGAGLNFLKPGPWFDLILSNPPYVKGDQPIGLQAGVRDFEPHLALFGGADGLSVYRKLFGSATHLLKPGGELLLEIGSELEEDLQKMGDRMSWQIEQVERDLAGLVRCMRFSRSRSASNSSTRSSHQSAMS